MPRRYISGPSIAIKLERHYTSTIPFGASPHSSQWKKVLADPAFEDVVAERWLRVRIASCRLSAIGPRIDVILRLIDEELEDD